jgi:hypothetical protein
MHRQSSAHCHSHPLTRTFNDASQCSTQSQLVHVQLLQQCPNDLMLGELRRHRRSLCRAMGRPRFADAAGGMDPDALPLLAVALLTAKNAASQSVASQLEVLQVVPEEGCGPKDYIQGVVDIAVLRAWTPWQPYVQTKATFGGVDACACAGQVVIPHTPLVCAWALPVGPLPSGGAHEGKAAVALWRRQTQLLGSAHLLQCAPSLRLDCNTCCMLLASTVPLLEYAHLLHPHTMHRQHHQGCGSAGMQRMPLHLPTSCQRACSALRRRQRSFWKWRWQQLRPTAGRPFSTRPPPAKLTASQNREMALDVQEWAMQVRSINRAALVLYKWLA